MKAIILALAFLVLAGTAGAGERQYQWSADNGVNWIDEEHHSSNRYICVRGDLTETEKVCLENLYSTLDKSVREHLIREFAATGEICRVLGHRWVEGPSKQWISEQIARSRISCVITWGVGEYQHCPVCGKTRMWNGGKP